MTISGKIKNLIIKKSEEGCTKDEIAKMLKVSIRSVFRILSQNKPTKPISKRCKNSKMRLNCIKRAFGAIKRSQRLITATRISKVVPCSLSVSTIRRYLKKLNCTYKNVPRKIILSSLQMANRVQVVRNWICQKIDPDEIVFTDESRFSLDGNDSMYSWTCKNDIFRQMRPYRGGSVMIWAAITKSGLIVYRRIIGTLDSKKYSDLIESEVLPLLNEHLATYIFQQDNASCHVSKYTKAMFQRNNVKLLEWPPKSPDLSPIEKFWGILKRRVYDGTKYSNLDQIWDRISKEIEEIQSESSGLISNLYHNYLGKMCDILCNNGALLK